MPRIPNRCRNRVLVPTPSKSSVLGLNAVLVEAPDTLTDAFVEETPNAIVQAMKDSVCFLCPLKVFREF